MMSGGRQVNMPSFKQVNLPSFNPPPPPGESLKSQKVHYEWHMIYRTDGVTVYRRLYARMAHELHILCALAPAAG